MDLQARKILCDVLAILTNDLPFYSFFAFSWKLVEVKGMGTFATDIENLYYDPDAVKKWDKEEVFFALVHEVIHCVYLHPGTFGKQRAGARDIALWLDACEYVTNSETKDALGLSISDLPKGILFDSKFDGKTAEEVYDELMKEPHHNTTWLKISVTGKKIETSCGSCGTPLNGELSQNDLKSGKCPCCGKTLPDRNSGYIDIHIPQDVREKIQQAIERILAGYEICKNKGTVAEGIERQIAKLKQSQVPWERVLHRLIGQVITDDEYRWEAPNHRHPLSDEYIIPGLRNEKVSEIVVAIDTSGSIGEEELTAFAGEMKKLHSLVEEITVLTCDADVHEKVRTRNIEEFLTKLKMKGGGGTDFKPVFDEIAKTRIKPSILVYFTDGYGDYPAEPVKDYPVLWVLTDHHQTPPWGYATTIMTGGKRP